MHKKLALLVSGLAVASAVSLPSAASASATPKLMHPDNTLYRCEISDSPGWCSTVTAIDPGSYLVLHKQPNYTGGTVAGSPHWTNGQTIEFYCWTTGAGDADGNGDTYWFNADTGVYAGWVNDWYLNTGSYSQWSRYVRHC